jgi:hypothetical protein
MPRIASLTLIGLVVIATTWVAAPAAPTPAPVRVSEAEMAEITAMVPLASEVDQQVERLRARMAKAPEPPAPRRDPFAFGAPRPEPVVAVAADVPVVDAPTAAEPEMLWPTLAAVMTEPAAEGVTRTAVLGWGDSVEFLAAGESFEGFRLERVTAGAIELMHIPTGVRRTLTLR